MYKAQRWIGLKIQAYTSSSKTGGEAELLLDTVLSNIRNWETKLKFVSLWAGKEASNMVDEDKKDSLKTMLDILKDWTRPKCDEIAAFTQLRTLNQGNKTLSTYIQEVKRVVDLCNFTCVGDCKDRLIRNSIMAGFNSTKAYQQCISKGSSLTLSECMKICQTGCHMQTSTSTKSRIFRLHREYICTQNSPVSPAARQTKPWGQRSLLGQ